MDELREAIKACAERLDRHRRPNQKIGEQNTKIMLIEPLLQALGWDLYDPEEVNREYRRRGADNPVDYALLLLRTPRLFVEAKGIGENIDDPRWANQTISYAAVAGVEWVALTDGAQWRIYNAHAPVPAEEKLFRSVDIVQDPDGAVEILDLLSKENMRENRIQELWQGYFVDRQIHSVLIELFTGTEPPADLVNLVAKRTERLSKDEVRASLIRARATFDFPLPALGSTVPGSPAVRARGEQPNVESATEPSASALVVTQTPAHVTDPAPPAPQTGPQKPRRSQVNAAERALKLPDLLRLGRIRPGPLTARYDGRTWQAQLADDGAITFNGALCPSLSKAGEAVKIASRGPDIPQSIAATDGWDFWSTKDATTGETVKLKEARRRAAHNVDPSR
ncbi:hypothetical protein GCM10023215_52560 [Pseudonocardia yuanmonensis]|uniref:RAMA domain-containing protein n=2 Tax=Pseudonocardia yuanmonensis TaxID=1095914 RepID=A0ABP8XFR0_9PSEU